MHPPYWETHRTEDQGGDRGTFRMDNNEDMKTEETREANGLIERAAGGDAEAASALFAGYRERLKRLVHLRLSRQLAGRLNQADVVRGDPGRGERAARGVCGGARSPDLRSG